MRRLERMSDPVSFSLARHCAMIGINMEEKMLEFITTIRKVPFKYQLKEGVLSHIIESSSMRHETSLNLKQDQLIFKQGRGVPFEFKLAIYGCVFAIAILLTWTVKDIQRENNVGIISSLISGMIISSICTYFAFQNRKKREHFLVKAKDGNGIYVYCENVLDKQKYEEFLFAIKNEVERDSGGKSMVQENSY
jgi:hypothetical protein